MTGRTIHLLWTRAAGTPRVKVLRRLNVSPTDPGDAAAVLVYDGSAEQADDSLSALLPTTTSTPRTYHYRAFGCDASAACETQGTRTQVAPTIVQCLRIGGYTIYWHHATADLCRDHFELGPASTTSVPDWWKSCNMDCATSTARQLRSAGAQQATTIGQNLSARGIPIGRVISSEFCRCVQTVQNMALDPALELDRGITLFVYDEDARCGECMNRLALVPTPGTNTAIIAHADFPSSCPVLDGLAPGEAAIYKPDGSGGATFVERVLADDWDTLP